MRFMDRRLIGGQLEEAQRDRAVLACRVLEPDQWCRRCGGEGTVRDTVTRRLAHEPLGWRPTTLAVTIRRCIARSLSLEVPTADDSR